jgi:hypothetical protein
MRAAAALGARAWAGAARVRSRGPRRVDEPRGTSGGPQHAASTSSDACARDGAPRAAGVSCGPLSICAPSSTVAHDAHRHGHREALRAASTARSYNGLLPTTHAGAWWLSGARRRRCNYWHPQTATSRSTTCSITWRRGPSVGQAAASMSDPTATGPNVQMGQPWRLSSDDAAGLRDVVGAVTSEQRQAQRGTGFSARL